MMNSEHASEVLDTLMPKMTSSPEQVELMQALNLAQHALSQYDPTPKEMAKVDAEKFKETMLTMFSETFVEEITFKLIMNDAFICENSCCTKS